MVYRILIADDSAVMRRLLVMGLASEPDICVVGQARDGAEAVRLQASLRPDVIVMDINMPVMDGLRATQRILEQDTVPIIVLSSYVQDPSSQMAFEAIRAGALAVIAKPAGPDELEHRRVHGELVRAVRSLAGIRLTRRPAPRTGPIVPMPAQSTPTHMRAVALIASNGGPAALHFLLRRLPSTFPVPILVVQHLPRGFVSGLVEWLGNDSALAVRVAQAGDVPQPGQALFAPDDYHMTVDAHGCIALSDDDPVDGHRPSGSALLHSVARVYGAQAVGVVLTGMGADGAAGLLSLKHAGGQTLTQDEASSIVYSMPREAATLGAAQAILSLERIVGHLLAIVP